MKITSGIGLALLGILLGTVMTSGLGVRQADAQQADHAISSRFQVSSYAGPTKEGFGHGCYIIDSATGELWHGRYGGQLEKVSGKVR